MASGWRVVYTYRVDGELYTGNYFDGAPNSTDVDTLFNPAQDSTNVYALKPDDTIEICYNPRQPAKNVYPNADSISLYGMAPWLIGAALALTVGLIVFFTRVSK
jgi:hypothetical protein